MLLSRLLPLLWVFKWASGVCFLLPEMFRDTDQSLKLELNSVTVQEGLCVLVPCTFIVKPRNMLSDLVFGYWYHEEKNTLHDSLVATNNPYQLVRGTQSRFHLSGDLRFNDCSLDIRDAQKSDSGSYFFSLKKEGVTWNFCEEKISVHVTDLTHTPSISIPQTLELGHPTDVICSVPWACERGTPPIFSWMSAAPISLGPTTTVSSVLTLTPRLQDHGTYLTCHVTFPGVGVTVQKTVQINVTYTAQNSTSHVSGRASPGKTEHLAEVVQVAMGEAAIKFLLLGICFFFLSMRPHEKRVERPATHVDHSATIMD